MVELALFVGLGLLILILFEVRARRESRDEEARLKAEQVAKERERQNLEGECCGQHLVCERETLLQTNAEVVYYDDEELDKLAGIDANSYTNEEADRIREVFHTLQENDVTGWVRSMQLRGIQLPDDVREEALLIVRERRNR